MRKRKKRNHDKHYIKLVLNMKAHPSHLFVVEAVQDGNQQALKEKSFSLTRNKTTVTL